MSAPATPTSPATAQHQHPPQQQQQVLPQPDPSMQAVIEAEFQPVDIELGPPNNAFALCKAHSLEKCAECDVDFVLLNRLSKFFSSNPALRCPPPAQVVNQTLSGVINGTKEEGNTFFRTRQPEKAAGRYTQAANYATQRAPWEAQGVMREELATVLSNRSAAYFEAGDYVAALTDADAVIQLKKPWSKGHFRKAKALVGLNRIKEAREAIQAGLQFEPQNAVSRLVSFGTFLPLDEGLRDIQSHMQEMIGTLNDIDRVLQLSIKGAHQAPTAEKSPQAVTA
ncbi:hypothetical protein EW146_g4781 [Bondarzewia mesenterica]|uniref:Uncharacterized protein n=1 Tax=Bondarzewia mesenterica TaxID=1095465 RepID=A0A4S4LUI6_9AGAM|nr:hypothetical protein EW146_g4781 [Bondarzewia mesenterica]